MTTPQTESLMFCFNYRTFNVLRQGEIMETLKEFGTRLRALRKERRQVQRQIAERLHITEVHYRRIEAGKVNIPTLTLCTLADYFGVTTDYLLGRSQERE